MWHQLHVVFPARTPGSVVLQKVKGHLAETQATTEVLQQDRSGNDGVDALAKQGARKHAPIQGTIDYLDGTRCIASRVHRMMLDVVEARTEALKAMLNQRPSPEPPSRAANLPAPPSARSRGDVWAVPLSAPAPLPFPGHIPLSWEDAAVGFRPGPLFLEALVNYLAALLWPAIPVQDHLCVTWLELAYDFELSTGVDIPRPSSRKALSQGLDRGPFPLGERARYLSALTRDVERIVGGPLLPAGRVLRCRALTPFGLPAIAGVQSRPVFAARLATARQLDDLLGESTLVRTKGSSRVVQASPQAALPEVASTWRATTWGSKLIPTYSARGCWRDLASLPRPVDPCDCTGSGGPSLFRAGGVPLAAPVVPPRPRDALDEMLSDVGDLDDPTLLEEDPMGFVEDMVDLAPSVTPVPPGRPSTESLPLPALPAAPPSLDAWCVAPVGDGRAHFVSSLARAAAIVGARRWSDPRRVAARRRRNAPALAPMRPPPPPRPRPARPAPPSPDPPPPAQRRRLLHTPGAPGSSADPNPTQSPVAHARPAVAPPPAKRRRLFRIPGDASSSAEPPPGRPPG